jgi:hypothetical protein
MNATLFNSPDSLTSMARATVERLQRDCLEHLAEKLAEVLKRDFADERHPKGNQRRAAREGLGISQAHISAIVNRRPGVGVGLEALLALRLYTGESIDQLLGLETANPVAASLDRMANVERGITELHREILAIKEGSGHARSTVRKIRK